MDRRSSIASMEQDHKSNRSVRKKETKKYFPQMFIELTEEVRVLKDMSDFFFLIYADSTGSMVV